MISHEIDLDTSTREAACALATALVASLAPGALGCTSIGPTTHAGDLSSLTIRCGEWRLNVVAVDPLDLVSATWCADGGLVAYAAERRLA